MLLMSHISCSSVKSIFCSRARLILRKKKYQEQLLCTADSQLENLEKLTQDLEFAVIEAQVSKTLKQ